MNNKIKNKIPFIRNYQQALVITSALCFINSILAMFTVYEIFKALYKDTISVSPIMFLIVCMVFSVPFFIMGIYLLYQYRKYRNSIDNTEENNNAD